MRRIEEAAVVLRTAGTGAAMQEQDGFALRVATLFPVQFVRGIDLENAACKWLDGWKKMRVGHAWFTVVADFEHNSQKTPI
jgi:hypothetical protein